MTTNTTQHTATPWHIDAWPSGDTIQFVSVGGRNVAQLARVHRLALQDHADAAYIVRAVNSHEALVAALQGCLDSQECNGYIGAQMTEDARAALALAEEVTG